MLLNVFMCTLATEISHFIFICLEKR